MSSTNIQTIICKIHIKFSKLPTTMFIEKFKLKKLRPHYSIILHCLALICLYIEIATVFNQIYNPQNEMFRKNKTKRSAPQNEMFLFRVPSPQHKTPQISLGRFCFQTIYIFRRSNQTSRSRHLQATARCALSCSRICVRFRDSALYSSGAVLSALP